MLKIRIHKLKDGRFQTCYLDPKTGKKKRSLFLTMKEAKDKARDSEIRFATMGISAFSTERVGQLMKYHLEKIPNSRVMERKNSFRSFLDAFGNHRISQLTAGDIQAWFMKFKEENDLSEKTLRAIKVQLNYFFHFLVNENILTANPLYSIKFKKHVPPRRPRVVLSIEEVEKLLINARAFDEKHLFPYLYMAVHTGSRRGEIVRLKRDRVDFATGLIHLRQTKNGLDRSVKMSDQLFQFMKTYLASHTSEYAFPGPEGRQFGREQIARLIRKFKHHFPMEKDWSSHALRHSLAYNFLKTGGKMYQLQAILGHRHIGTTVDLYGQIGAQDVAKPSPYNF
jgi:site-specific recombinase XerD